MSCLFHENLVIIGMQASDKKEVVQKFSELFLANGFVKQSYPLAVLTREESYPTGLQLDGIGVAIPHVTGSEHVITSAIGIARLESPVEFYQMGDSVVKVRVELVFMMSILHPDDQLDVLQKMMEIFENDYAMQEFRKAKSKDELCNVAEKYIKIDNIR